MIETYKYDEQNNALRVYYPPGVHNFCRDNNVRLEEFNLPVVIDDTIKSCSSMFKGCRVFNQKVIIPDGVDDCYEMFLDCESFNQPINLPESVKRVYHMFMNCKSFNQTIKIPPDVKKMVGMFVGCEALNQPIILPENGEIFMGALKDCKSFNQKVTLPETATDCICMFFGCSSFNQPVTIGENVERCGLMFTDCVELNQPIQLLSPNCLCDDMFKNCTSLLPENVTLYCKRLTRKNLEKKLQKVWGTEEIKDKTNIVTVKTKKTAKVSNIHYTLEGNYSFDIESKEIRQLTLQEIHERLENVYDQGGLLALEISEESEESMKTLTIYFDKQVFCIAVIDEWNDTVYYYDSGEGEESVNIQGNVYPRHMVSEDKELLFLIVDEFLKSCKPTKKVKWVKE